MTVMLDLGPVTDRMARLLDGVTDEQLSAPTPCEEYTLADLIDHIDRLSQAFTAAAEKDLGPLTSQAPSPAGSQLSADWRTRVPERLAALAEAWRKPQAWEGMTQAGGVDLPSEMAGKIAANELLLHGWDVARATGQPFAYDPATLEASLEFVSMMSTPEEEAGREGLFGPVVEVPADAPLLHRVIGMSGRDPAWKAPEASRQTRPAPRS